MNTKFQLLKRATRFALVLLLLSAAGMTKAFAQKSWTNVRVSAIPPNGGTVSGGGYYYYGELVTISASANQGYTFKYWKCNKCGHIVTYQASYSFIWGDGHHHYQGLFGSDNGYYSFTAYFSHIYNITVSANPGNGGTVTGGGTYNEGDSCTLIASPNMGYHFVKWTKNGSQVSTNPTYSFTVTENASYVAQFSSNSCSISATANPTEGGTVTGDGIHNVGETCTLTATPNEGYLFNNWTENGMVVSFNPSYSFTVFGDRTLVANFVEAGSGILNGVFSVSDSIQVNFSQGNLQYQAYTNTWRFALNQYECIGSDNINISATYDGWIDLFGWGTSGYNHGAVCYQPWSTSIQANDYYAYGIDSYNLFDQTGQADWGYNAISNGGNQTGQWRTLTRSEWYYLFCTRATSSGMRFAKACVNNVNGVILLPDNWVVSYFALNNPNQSNESYGSNTITAAQWSTLEEYGAVFLPAAGIRKDLTSISHFDARGYYWASTVASNNNVNAYCFTPAVDTIWFQNSWRRYYGMSVRLVCPASDAYSINATANPAEGGTVSGVGNYNEGSTCTLTAMANEGYTFMNWTKDGEVVSTLAVYNFTVTEGGNYVANFGLNTYDVTAMANPEQGGTVQGSDVYNYGTTATLIATANTDYVFVSWTENGTTVSTENYYSFIVTGNRTLVANFEMALDNHYEYDPFLYPGNMTVTGIIQIEGVEQRSAALEVGTFCNGECRGAVRPTFMPNVDRYFVFLTIYGNNGDEISFRLYDHVTGEESDKLCESTLTFEVNAIVGNALNPFIFNFVDVNTIQATNFNNGWNWWSSYIEFDGSSLQSLENNLGTRGMMIKSQNDGYASYLDGFGWYGSLSAINNESSYQIRTNEACTVEMTGFVANPAEHPIELHTGWTWVGYPVNVTMGIADAMSGIAPLNGDMLKSQNNGYASYLEGFGWYGSLNTLQPGMGLMYKSNNGSTVTLVYPNNTTRTDLKANQTTEGNHWQPNLNAYADNMSVMAVVELDGIELQGENYELAVFANGEVRGSARLLYVEPLNRYMAFLTVAGDEAAGLNFGLYDTETGAVETQCFASLPYETNAIIGSFDEPYVVSFRSTTGMDEWAGSLQVFPNPVEHGRAVSLGFDGVETSKVTVEIINALGSVVETLHATSLQRITAPETAGVYTLKITVEGKGTGYRKLVVR